MIEQETSFMQRLKQRRKELDLTQLDLAERLGCSEDTVQKIEAGGRRPSRQVAQLLAQCLEIPREEWPAFVQFARMGDVPTAGGVSHVPLFPAISGSGAGRLQSRAGGAGCEAITSS